MNEFYISLDEEQNDYIEYAARVLQISKADVLQRMVSEHVTKHHKLEETAKEIEKYKNGDSHERNNTI
jgi:hypothetical protein